MLPLAVLIWLPPPLVAVFFAQSTAPDNVWINATERLGIGIVVAAVFGLALRRVYNEKAELEASLRTEVIPAMVKATDTMERMAALMERLERRLDAEK